MTNLEAATAYHDRLAGEWGGKHVSGGFAKRLEVFRSILIKTVRPETNWLDAGCGSGLLTEILLNADARVTALDSSEQMVKVAKRSFPDELASAQLIVEKVKTLESTALPEACFDGILCSSVIEYVDHPGVLLKEFRRLLVDRGIMVISIPNRSSILRRFQKATRRFAEFLGLNLFDYLSVSKVDRTIAAFTEELSAAGFSVQSTTLFDPLLPEKLIVGWSSLLIVVCSVSEMDGEGS